MSRTRSSAIAASPVTRSRSASASASSRSTSCRSARQLAAALVHLRGARARGDPAGLQLLVVAGRALAFGLDGHRPLAERGVEAAGLGEAGLRGLGGGARLGDGGGGGGDPLVSAFAIPLRGQQALLDLGQPDRRRALLVLGLDALGVEDGALAHQPGALVLGHGEVVADRDQLLLRAVDLLFQRARLGGGDVGRGGVLLRAPPHAGQRLLEQARGGPALP